MRVEASQPCMTCGEEITKVALTEAEARAVYEWVSQSANCQKCIDASYSAFWC